MDYEKLWKTLRDTLEKTDAACAPVLDIMKGLEARQRVDATSDRACLVRTSDSGEAPLIDVLTVPYDTVHGPDADAKLYDLIRTVTVEYARANGVTSILEPVDFVNLPSEYLAAHGITVTPVDVPMSVMVDMDDVLFDPEEDLPDSGD